MPVGATPGSGRVIGNDSTHGRTGTRGMTLITEYAAVCAMSRVPHEGHMPQLAAKDDRHFARSPRSARRVKPSARMTHYCKLHLYTDLKTGPKHPLNASSPACAAGVALQSPPQSGMHTSHGSPVQHVSMGVQ